MFPHGFTTSALPLASREADAQQTISTLNADASLATYLGQAEAQRLIAAVAGNSGYLARLLVRHKDSVRIFLTHGADDAYARIQAALDAVPPDLPMAELMARLRQLKEQLALTVAMADISTQWRLKKITGALSEFAERSVQIALRHILLLATARGEINPANPQAPEQDSGIIILGMGKLGGRELNYSSDIDLMVLFDKEQLPYTGARNAQHFMNRVATDLVTLMQERTSDGYVFRTDLRLRPDPMSTPLAVNTTAALAYYETVGQNWERAAMIKARTIAGDTEAGHLFLRELIPFLWRKTLDFATIADIHSIKRQMNVGRGLEMHLAGHNVKTGVGGIREIEFFVATQQLVWGGRIPELRTPATLDALDALTEFELVDAETRSTLRSAYHFLRTLEHRLQMQADAQTHTLPETPAALAEVGCFMGFKDPQAFAETCLATFDTVHTIYTESMVDAEPLAVDGNLVFTGVEADPDTLETLARMGYTETQRVSDIIQGWHRGSRRSTRSKRSRQVLTELVPALLLALGKTANPDVAFFHFDDFIDRLPSGAQIFSLFNSRPELLELLADILGSAPALGDTLSNDPSLLDAVLEADFFEALPEKNLLENLLTDRLRYAHEYEQKMGYLRTFHNEKRFQAGVHLLKRIATPKQVGTFLSDLAEVILQTVMQEVWAEYGQTGLNTPFAIVGLGKLGGREMTFDSDLDIIFLYDDTGDPTSENRTHLHRISQRLISALTLLTREGRLYEVDTRLRPGGMDGPLATSLRAFDQYFAQTAWTYEHMALTRSRVVATNHPVFAERIDAAIRSHVLKPQDPEKLLADVVDMRSRIAKEFATRNPWALKHVRGGTVDIDFIAQYLILRHGHTHPAIWHRGARRVFETAADLQLLDATLATQLIEAKKFLSDLMSLLRLSAPGGLITDDAPAGLKRLLVEGMQVADFETLKSQVENAERRVQLSYAAMESGNF